MRVQPSYQSDAKRYWVVSPNVMDNEETVGQWKELTWSLNAAFMGYRPDDERGRAAGYKFAHVIRPGHVLLIARSSDNQPDLVGAGVVTGPFKKSLRGLRLPRQDKSWTGSLRLLSTFHSITSVPKKVPLMSVLGRPALRELRPSRSAEEKIVCDWLDGLVGSKRRPSGRRPSGPKPPGPLAKGKVASSSKRPQHREMEFEVKSAAQLRLAIKKEEKLVRAYEAYLKKSNRILSANWYGRLQCDGYEETRKNLVEAKSSVKREHIRMAVGQLLDYAHLGKDGIGKVHMAILLPGKPDKDIGLWLKNSLKISIIWKTSRGFEDNAGKQFT
jgi:hypothetical protein